MSWQSLTEHPAAATTVLAVALALCLLIAKIYVVQNPISYKSQEWHLADVLQKNPLLEKVAADGLEEYLGRENIARYYLIELGDQAIGYGAWALEPQLDSNTGQLVYRGREIWNTPQEGRMRYIAFTVPDDLSWYTHQLRRKLDYQGEKIQVDIIQNYRSGILEASLSVKDQHKAIGPIQIPAHVIMPPGFLDIISSIAARDASPGEKTDSLMMIDPEAPFAGGGDMPITRVQLRTCSPDNVPENIRQQHPEGLPVQVFWMDQLAKQVIYYDDQHQIIWQQDMTQFGPQTITVVEKDELIEKFPETQELLEKWHRQDQDQQSI